MKKKHVIITLVGALFLCIMCMTPRWIKLIKASVSHHKIDVAYEGFLESDTTFYDNTTINGIDVSGLDEAAAFQKVKDDFESRTLTITNPWNDTRDILAYKDLNVDFSGLESFVKTSFDQRHMTEEEFSTQEYKSELSYDITADIDFLRTDLSSISILDESRQTVPSDASLTYDAKTGTLEVVREVYGNVFKDGVFAVKLKQAILNGDETLDFSTGDYILPKVTSTDEAFIKEKETVENYLNKTVELSLCGSKLTISNDDVKSFIDLECEDYLSTEVILAYVKRVCDKFNTYGDDRTFVTSTGETIVIPGGNYGWLIDDAGTVTKIKKALSSEKKTAKTEAAYKVKGQRPASNEISNTYVEVSLRDQRIWMYKDGQLIVSDDCTTGMVGDPECHTNCGTFRLKYKTTNRVLKGPTWEDFVYYWMPFDGGIGLHDATWRTEEEFGGTNRYGNGSHGCVNLRLATAETVYNNLEADVPIIVWE